MPPQLSQEERIAVLERAFADAVKHHISVHEMEEQALRLRTQDLERRLEEMNNFRDQISNERLMYVTREVYEQRHEDLSKRINILEMAGSNLQGRIVVIVSVFGLIIVLVTKFWH